MRIITIVLTVCTLALCIVSDAAENRTYRDASGRVTATASTTGNTTTYRDASGRVIGTASTTGNTTTYRDASGRVTATASTTGRSAPGSSSRRPPITLI